MGTLFDQRVRAALDVDIDGEYRHIPGDDNHSSGYTDTVESRMGEVISVAEATGTSVSDVIALFAAMQQMRANDLMVRDQDIKDEQLSGFGHLIKELIETIDGITQGD